MLVRIKNHIPDGPSGFHEPGQIKHTSQMPGCDVGWLVSVGALEPIGAKSSATLIGDDPSQDELIAEIGRMQTIIETREAELAGAVADNDRVRQELAAARAMPKPAAPVVVPPDEANAEIARLKAVAEDFRKAIVSLRDERDHARERADQYAARLTQLEKNPDVPAEVDPSTLTPVVETPAGVVKPEVVQYPPPAADQKHEPTRIARVKAK